MSTPSVRTNFYKHIKVKLCFKCLELFDRLVKLKMHRQRRPNTTATNRGRSSFFCCSCFSSKRKSISTSTVMGLSETNEPYDYVVEKLAIKKVPLRLFATDEEFQSRDNAVSTLSTVSNVTHISEYTMESDEQPEKKPTEKPSVKPVKKQPLVVENTSSVAFSTYYKFSPQLDVDRISKTPERPLRDDSITHLYYEPEREVMCHVNYDEQPKKPRSETEEKNLVAHILNKHSSLFTVDGKNPIPKDPNHPIEPRTVVPTTVKAALHNKRPFPALIGLPDPPYQNRNTIKAIPPQNKAPSFSTATKCQVPPYKKELTPELKQTIDALGFAQKPHVRGFPPKNQKGIFENTITEGSVEREIKCNFLASDAVSQELPIYKAAEQKAHGAIALKKPGRHSSEEIGNNTNKSETSARPLSEGTVTISRSKKIDAPKIAVAHDDKSVLAVLSESSDQLATTTYSESANTTDSHTKGSENITEISQLKGQSLKWKIIIKHHADKKNDNKAILNKSQDSDSDCRLYRRSQSEPNSAKI